MNAFNASHTLLQHSVSQVVSEKDNLADILNVRTVFLCMHKFSTFGSYFPPNETTKRKVCIHRFKCILDYQIVARYRLTYYFYFFKPYNLYSIRFHNNKNETT